MDNPQKADCLSLRVRFTGGDGTISGYALGEGLGSFLSDIEPLEVYYYDSYDFIEALNLDDLQYQDYCCPVKLKTANESSPKPSKCGLRAFIKKK